MLLIPVFDYILSVTKSTNAMVARTAVSSRVYGSICDSLARLAPSPDLHPGSILGPLWGLSGQIHKGPSKWGSCPHPEVFDDEQDYGSNKPEVPGVKLGNDVHECLAFLKIPC